MAIYTFTEETMNEIGRRFKEPEWLSQRRKSAYGSYENMQMPKENEEPWRYTNIEKFDLSRFAITAKDALKLTLPDELAAKGVILADMRTAFQKYGQSLQSKFLFDADIGKDKIMSMNTAFWHQGYFLYVPKNVEANVPVKCLLDAGQSSAVISHSMVIAEPGSRINFIEEYGSNNPDESLHIGVVEVFAEENAKVNFFSFHNWAEKMNNLSMYRGHVGRNASLNWVMGSFGGRLSRLKTDTYFRGQGGSGNTVGVFFGSKDQHHDITTNAIHLVTHTTNNITVNGVVKDKATSVYRGLIKIAEKAQETISYLSNHILMLHDTALANTIPSLEIDSNDVKASHGATVGHVDEEQIFYLMSRGLSREESEKAIVDGFFEPVLGKIPDLDMRTRFKAVIEGK